MLQKMYYYTSTETMQKILTNRNIFATNLDYMNDARECINGLEEIRKILLDGECIERWKKKYPKYSTMEITEEEINKRLSEEMQRTYLEDSARYSISFCEENDLLSQWTTYAKESGVSIAMEFDIDKLYSFCFYGVNSNGRNKRAELSPSRVLYYTKGMGAGEAEIEEEILSNLFMKYDEKMGGADYITLPWRHFCNYIKTYSFYQEKEFRLLFDSINVSELPGIRVDYRTDKHVIKPYLDVECEGGWPITEIMVGPGFNQQVVYRSIAFFLDHAQVYSQQVKKKEQYINQVKGFFNDSGVFEEFQVRDQNTFTNIQRKMDSIVKEMERFVDGDVELKEKTLF